VAAKSSVIAASGAWDAWIGTRLEGIAFHEPIFARREAAAERRLPVVPGERRREKTELVALRVEHDGALPSWAYYGLDPPLGDLDHTGIEIIDEDRLAGMTRVQCVLFDDDRPVLSSHPVSISDATKLGSEPKSRTYQPLPIAGTVRHSCGEGKALSL
jgi:hypothetical protein